VRLDVSRYTAVRLDSTCLAWCTKDTGVIGAFIAALQSERVSKSLSDLLVAICLPSSQLTAMLERELVRYGASVLTFNASSFSSRFVQSTATQEIPRFTALMLGEDMLVNPTGANTMSSFARSLMTELEQRRLPAPTCCIGLVDIVRFRGYDASHESLPDGDRQMLHRSLNTLRLSSKATPGARSPSPEALLRRSVYFSMISPVRTLELIHHFEALCNSYDPTQAFNPVTSVPSETVSRNPLSAHLWNSQPTMSTEEASRLRTLAARSSFLMGSPSDHLPPPARSALQIRKINTNESAPTPSTQSSQSSAAPSPLIDSSKAPLRSPDGPSVSNVSPSTSSSSPAQSLSSNTSLSPVTPNSSNRMLSGLPAISLRMLIVDDMPFNQKALHMQLRSALGTANAALTSFDFADDGAQAVALVKAAKAGTQGPYDLIWMDLHMPVMDGVDAIRNIRQFEVEQRQAGSNINQYIVAITANNQVDDQNRSLAAGATVFIAKPAPPAKIKQVLQDVCERRQGGSPRR
jgi:CheY-like chemotaxis protein